MHAKAIAGFAFGFALLGCSSAWAAPCHRPDGATTVISGHRAIVFTKPGLRAPDGGETRQRYWGCLKPTGRLRRLHDTHPAGLYIRSSAGQFRLAGSFVAFVVTETDHYGGFSRAVIESDLSGRRAKRQAAFGGGQLEGAGGAARQLDILRLRMSSSGSVAWLQRDTDAFGKRMDRLLTFASSAAPMLETAPHTGAHQLDVGPVGNITKVSLRGRLLSWLNAGMPHSVELSAW